MIAKTKNIYIYQIIVFILILKSCNNTTQLTYVANLLHNFENNNQKIMNSIYIKIKKTHQIFLLSLYLSCHLLLLGKLQICHYLENV